MTAPTLTEAQLLDLERLRQKDDGSDWEIGLGCALLDHAEALLALAREALLVCEHGNLLTRDCDKCKPPVSDSLLAAVKTWRALSEGKREAFDGGVRCGLVGGPTVEAALALLHAAAERIEKPQQVMLEDECRQWRHVAEYYLGSEYTDVHTPEECRAEAVRRAIASSKTGE